MSLFNKVLFDLSNKFKNKELHKLEITNILAKEIGTKIQADEIKIKDGVIFINSSPTIKSIIFLKKQKILKELSPYNITSIQ